MNFKQHSAAFYEYVKMYFTDAHFTFIFYLNRSIAITADEKGKRL